MLKRHLGIELLRIISMLMVVIFHIYGYGLKNATYNDFGLISFSEALLKAFSIVGVNVFVLISGYFLSVKKYSLSKEGLMDCYKRLLPLWIQVEMYSIGIYLVLCAIPQSGVPFEINQLIRCALPLLTGQYWFFTDYFLLIIITPFINVMINNLEKKQYRNMLIVLLCVFSIVPSVNIFGDTFETQYGFSLLWFFVLYVVGGYIRKFGVKSRNYGLIYIAFVAFLFICNMFGKIAPSGLSGLLGLFTKYTSIFVFFASVSLFLTLLKIKRPFKNIEKLIILISSLSFAVYLIHEHNVFRDNLWNQIIGLDKYIEHPFMCLLIILISVVIIYIISILIELIRMKLFLLIKNVLSRLLKRNIYNSN